MRGRTFPWTSPDLSIAALERLRLVCRAATRSSSTREARPLQVEAQVQFGLPMDLRSRLKLTAGKGRGASYTAHRAGLFTCLRWMQKKAPRWRSRMVYRDNEGSSGRCTYIARAGETDLDGAVITFALRELRVSVTAGSCTPHGSSGVRGAITHSSDQRHLAAVMHR